MMIDERDIRKLTLAHSIQQGEDVTRSSGHAARTQKWTDFFR